MNHSYNAVITASVLFSKQLSDREKLLVALISNLSNEKGYCFASNKYLGECLSCSEETIRKSLKNIEDLGGITRVLKLNKKNEVEFRAIIITSHNLPQIDVPKSRISSSIHSRPSPQNGGDPSPPEIPHNRIDLFNSNKELNLGIDNTNRKKTREIFLKEKFQEFWDLYDKKVDRETTFRRFSKLKESEIEKALKVIPIYKKSQPDKKYRKNPSTWLNGRCWEDEYEPEVTQQNTLNENGENIRDSFFSEFI